jgi:molybdopterin synthase sulfur carrier subunit
VYVSVTVKYFASIRESVGRGEEIVDLPQACSVGELWQRLTKRPLPPRLLVAVNQEYAGLDATLRDGDEVAFFPPVTGG